MYTSEFAIPEPRLVILTETVGAEPPAPERKPERKAERKRRGRRGGESNGNGGPVGPGENTGPAKDA